MPSSFARARARASTRIFASSSRTSACLPGTSVARSPVALCETWSAASRRSLSRSRTLSAAFSRASVSRLCSCTAGMPTATTTTARASTTNAPIPSARHGTGGTSTSRAGVHRRVHAPSTSQRLSFLSVRARGMKTPLNTLSAVEVHRRGIEVEGLVREFKEVHAVAGIDLEVAAGEIYGFLGPNGAGKSTTVLMLTTLLPATSGRATVGGFDIAHEGAKVRGVIGAALQEAALDPLLTGREHVQLQATLRGLPRAARKPRSADLLDRVGLTEAADRRVGGYSGGMKRRLDLALALVHGPRILFLDEPTTGLDPQSRTGLWAEVARLAREDGVTVFLTTQYLEEADVLADRVGIIDHGRIVAEDTPAALKAEIGRPSVHVLPCNERDRPLIADLLRRFGEPLAESRADELAVRLRGGVGMADVIRALDSDGVVVDDVELRAPTLDDVFLAKTGRSLEGAAD